MVTLQRPDWVFYDGEVRPWEDATFHVSSEAVVRGTNIFEGLKGYWQPDGQFGIVAMPRHHTRLQQSAKLMHMPFEATLEEFRAAHHALLERLLVPESNTWVRATVYVEEGHWGEATKSNMVLTAYTQPKGAPAPVRTGISAWQRARDVAMPYRLKTSANYQVARFARIEARPHGYTEMLLLNQHGRLAEGTGACIMIVRDGTVITPPPHEGRLESITLDILLALAEDMGIPTEVRPVDQTEIKIADEIGLCGTLNELTQIIEVDGFMFPEGEVLGALQRRYLDAVTGIDPHPAADLDLMPAP